VIECSTVYFEMADFLPCVSVIFMPFDKQKAAFLSSHTDIKGFLHISNKRRPSIMMTYDDTVLLGCDAV
jgi:hypothetical protein